MKKIYENAKGVLIWIGTETQIYKSKDVIGAINTISKYLCHKLGISVSDPGSYKNIYHEIVFKNRDLLPTPDKCEFSNDGMWKSLAWFYSHPYFTRVWAIQEINANRERWVHCGHEKVEWDRVDLVAAYITMEPVFSRNFGFTGTYCWWATTVTELTSHPHNWLFMLYLASNFACTDQRDRIYGLRGLMTFSDGAELLAPDYGKSTLQTYRDSVQAAFVNFQNADALLYVIGNEIPSWIPRWNEPMLFRNPFRFGNALPWKPAGDTKASWDIDKDVNALSLFGFIFDSIKFNEPYNESFFGNAMIDSDEGRNTLRHAWQRIMDTIERSQPKTPLSTKVLNAAAASLSFGLDEKSRPADERYLIHNFVAYLGITLDNETYDSCIPSDLSEESKGADGHAFGKPVWDFKYPDSSFFITEGNSIGCAIASTEPGDLVCVALGSTYPLILRPDGDCFLIRGYAFVHGIMRGEHQNSEKRLFKIH